MTPQDGAQAVAQLVLLGEAISRLSDVAVFVWDDDRNYVAVNDAACALTGLSREQLLAMRVGDGTADRAEPHFTRVREHQMLRGSHQIEAGGETVELEWISCRTTVAGLPYFVSVCWPATTPS